MSETWNGDRWREAVFLFKDTKVAVKRNGGNLPRKVNHEVLHYDDKLVYSSLQQDIVVQVMGNDWSYLIKGVFPREAFPTDIDGAIEIDGHLLIIETKGKESPSGAQLSALLSMASRENVTVMEWYTDGPGDTNHKVIVYSSENWLMGVPGRPAKRSFSGDDCVVRKFMEKWVKESADIPAREHSYWPTEAKNYSNFEALPLTI